MRVSKQWVSKRSKRTGVKACAEALESRQMLSAGLPDSSFGTSGIENLNLTNQSMVPQDDEILAIARQPDGKLVAVGTESSLRTGVSTLAILRFTATGALDPSFANGGIFQFAQQSSVADAVGLQSDGKIVAGGWTHVPAAGAATDDDFLLVRLNTDGSLDSTFGTGGVVMTGAAPGDYGETDHINALQVEPSGQILAAGHSAGNGGGTDRLARFNADGSIDTSFGTDGFYYGSYGNGEGMTDLALLSNGQALALGNAYIDPGSMRYDGPSLSRYNSDGSLDSTFAQSGYVHDASTSGLVALHFAVDAADDAVYVVAGYGQSFLLKYSLEGVLQTNFGTGGMVPLGTDSYSGAAAVQPDGDIVTAVTSGVGSGSVPLWIVSRYLPSGQLDSSFGGNTGQAGSSLFSTGTGSVVNSVVIQPDGSSIISGTDGTNFKLIKLLGDSQAPAVGSISGSAFSDANGNGLQDSGEPGLANVTLYIDQNGNGVDDPGEPTAVTNASGVFTFSNVSAGTYQVREIVPSGYSLSSPSSGFASATVVAQQVTANVSFGNAPLVASPLPLKGTVIGTSGSYKNDGNTAAKAFDGNLTTFFDGPTASGNWVGLDLGSAKIITSLAYVSRSGWASRMNGGVFQASNSSTFSSGVVNLYTIASNANPSSTALTTQTVSNAGAYRYVRYSSPANSYGDVAEIEFFGKAPVITVDSISGVVTGAPAGTTVYLDANGNSKFDSGELSTTTGSNGSYSFSNVPAGSYVIREVLPSGYTQTMPASNGGYSITVTSGSSFTSENFTDKAPTNFTRLTGTTIGTAGSYQNDGYTISKATDGNLSTMFVGPTANGNWVGYDLGSSKSISQIKFAPASGWASRLVGAQIQISTTANFTSGVTTIYTITAAPVVGSLTTVTLSSPVTARYVRYLSPSGSYGEIAEFQVFG